MKLRIVGGNGRFLVQTAGWFSWNTDRVFQTQIEAMDFLDKLEQAVKLSSTVVHEREIEE